MHHGTARPSVRDFSLFGHSSFEHGVASMVWVCETLAGGSDALCK